MVGITDYGFYVPRYRLERSEIARSWGRRGGKGERAVANYDEDSFTLATEAASRCLEGGTGSPDAVFFASTSSPYGEKQVASYVATVCDLPRGLWSADFTGSARAGLSAVLAAWHAVASGRCRDVLVTAADVRVAEVEGELEAWFGDGAAALRVGRDGVLAEFVDSASVSEEFTHFWRLDDSRTVRVFSGRFSDTYGYVRDVSEAARALVDRHRLGKTSLRLVVASTGSRAALDLAKALGLDPERQLVTPPYDRLGSTGVADPLFALVRGLETSSAGDRLLLAGYGEGADVLLLRVHRKVQKPALENHLGDRLPLPSYAKYLKFRRLLPFEETGEAITNVLEFKELEQDVRLHGNRCRHCGLVQYPMARVCLGCRRPDGLEPHKLERRGEIFTFTVDHLIANVELPLPMLVVELNGGGRLYVQGTDMTEEEARVGKPVVLTFRRLHDGGGNHNYFWKARPPR